jgi:hypothetical protein
MNHALGRVVGSRSDITLNAWLARVAEGLDTGTEPASAVLPRLAGDRPSWLCGWLLGRAACGCRHRGFCRSGTDSYVAHSSRIAFAGCQKRRASWLILEPVIGWRDECNENRIQRSAAREAGRVLIRHLSYFVTLARVQHYARGGRGLPYRAAAKRHALVQIRPGADYAACRVRGHFPDIRQVLLSVLKFEVVYHSGKVRIPE